MHKKNPPTKNQWKTPLKFKKLRNCVWVYVHELKAANFFCLYVFQFRKRIMGVITRVPGFKPPDESPSDKSLKMHKNTSKMNGNPRSSIRILSGYTLKE